MPAFLLVKREGDSPSPLFCQTSKYRAVLSVTSQREGDPARSAIVSWVLFGWLIWFLNESRPCGVLDVTVAICVYIRTRIHNA